MESSLVTLDDVDLKRGTPGALNKYVSQATAALNKAWKLYNMRDKTGDFELRESIDALMDQYHFNINLASMISIVAVQRLKEKVDAAVELVRLKIDVKEDEGLVTRSVALMDQQRILEVVCARKDPEVGQQKMEMSK